MSQKHVHGSTALGCGLWTFARLVSLSHPKQRLVSTSTLSQTSLTSPTMPWIPWVSGHTNSVTVATFCLVGQEKWREQNHPTCRLAVRLVSAHISQWDVKFAGKWDSALKGNSALRAHVARAAAIESAHNEGQYVIHFLWDMRKFYHMHQSTSSDSATGGKGLLAGDVGLRIVDTNHRDASKSATDTATSSMDVHPAFWQVVSTAALGPEAYFLKRSKLWGTWFLDRSAKKTSMICHNLLRIRPANSCFMTQH